MKLTIKDAEVTDREQLRTLLIDGIEELAGEGAKILEPRLPWSGFPLLLVDADAHPVLVSFDTDAEDSALIDGLNAVDRLSTALPWVNQVYKNLLNEQRAPKLIIVCKNDPPGAKSILTNGNNLTLFRYRLLKVNDETGLWLEAIKSDTSIEVKHSNALAGQQPIDEIPTITEIKPKDKSRDTELPPFNDEEASYFQQL